MQETGFSRRLRGRETGGNGFAAGRMAVAKGFGCGILIPQIRGRGSDAPAAGGNFS